MLKIIATVTRSRTVLPTMQPICTHTISVQSAKPSHAYPIIRLPRAFRELAGSKVAIYQTVHDGKLAFLVTTDQRVDNCCTTLDYLRVESRLNALETKIEELRGFFNEKESVGANDIGNDRKTRGRGRDSNPRRGLHRAIG